MQALDLYGPVQRLEVLIKRGKGERHTSGKRSAHLRSEHARHRLHRRRLARLIRAEMFDRTFPKFKLRASMAPAVKKVPKPIPDLSDVVHPPKNADTRTALDSFIGSQAFIAAAPRQHGPNRHRGAT
jgi:hypothetical protein